MSGAFSKTQGGPNSSTGFDTDKISLVFDQQNNIVESVDQAGNSHGLQTSLAILLAQGVLNAITTAQNLINLSLNPGVLNKLKRTISVTGFLVYTSAGTTTPAITIALIIGGVTVCTITLPAMSATARTNAPIQFFFLLEVASTGSAGTIESHGQVDADLNAAAGASLSAIADANSAVSSAVNLQTAAAIQVTIAANLAVTSATLRMAQIEVLN